MKRWRLVLDKTGHHNKHIARITFPGFKSRKSCEKFFKFMDRRWYLVHLGEGWNFYRIEEY